MQKIMRLLIILSILLSSTVNVLAKQDKNTADKSTEGKTLLSPENQRRFDYYFHEAVNAKMLDKYSQSYDYFNYCLEIDSTNATALYELGNIYNSLQEKDLALEYYQKSVKYDANNLYYNMALASLNLELQKYPEAINIYESIIAEYPKKIELNLYLSEAYRLSGNLPKAIDALNNLETIVGLNEKLSFQKFQLYSALDNKKKAYAEVLKYIEKYPTDIKYNIFLGNLYLQDNRNQDAFLAYSKAKSIDPDDPYLITSMAAYYEKTNNKPAAEKELHTALLSSKIDIDTKLGILAQYVSTLQQNENDTKRANALFDTLMTQHPQEPKLNFMYGNLLLIQQKLDEAHFQFQIYAESDPTNPIGWEQLIKTTPPDSIKQNIKICETAISYIPEEPLFYFYLGISKYQEENHKGALEALLKGVKYANEANPNLASEYYGLLGSLYHELDKADSSFIAFDKSLKFNPGNLGVLNNYSYYLSLQRKNLDKAEKMSSITIKAEPTNPTYLDTYGWVLFEQGAYTTAKIYLENAVKYSLEKEKEISSEVLEHFGDVLFMTDETDKALEYWIKAKEKGSTSKTLDKKINLKKYIAE